PTAERILQVLPSYNITHFACHGISAINPAYSQLLLVKESMSHGGFPTEEADKLHVKDIAMLKLPESRLDYISVTNSTSLRLIDQVTYIVSSFHIAGSPHVT
ncbi:hypothetical protein EV426DRAFT_540491, partial [Tirmania nivea]